ncbi:zinc finger protein 79 isoform X1 [Agrilus planipennis]|uniref:Zinc finger protein 79 isoform X1 n=1 Tax=Agrilus planipennis TaxID=224129 RepID=A0A1W4X062_AGRPL|nr:zinc finger protein 79 isoform X1 [Agrilus planipennis]XP_018329525.1 zinc finger protein 79 isoform X1 [Agrilus planipennis]XP_018329526.1 zinc finger protein 79 isoform X1 [Agrilus planipennis]
MSECNSYSLNALKISSEIPTTILEDSLNNDEEDISKNQAFDVLMKQNDCTSNKVEWEAIELPDIQGNETFISESILLCSPNDHDLIKLFGKPEENVAKSNIVVRSYFKIKTPQVTSYVPSNDRKASVVLDKCDILEEALNSQFFVKIKPEDGKMEVLFRGIDSQQILPSHYVLPEYGNVDYLSLEEQVQSLTKTELVPTLNKKMPCIQLQSSICIWLCPHHQCRIAFLRFSAAKNHTLLHFGCKPYKCDHPGCNWAFFTSFKLKRHKDTHIKKKDFVCHFENCGRQFTTIYNLACHKRLHERPANFECTVPECKALFQTVRARELHLKTHGLAEAPYRCQVESCNKTFFLATALMSHARIHSHKESEVRCQWPNCGRIFEQPCRLKEHVRQHTGHRPYVCNYDNCKWAFTTASKLKRHLSTHTNDRKFQCTIGNCTKAFLRSEHLREHTLTHIGQRNGNDTLTPAKRSQPECSTSSVLSISDSSECPSPNVLLEQAVQSLEVPSDVIMGTGILPEETLELLPHESFEKFSTVNLKDLRNLD